MKSRLYYSLLCTALWAVITGLSFVVFFFVGAILSPILLPDASVFHVMVLSFATACVTGYFGLKIMIRQAAKKNAEKESASAS
ncbi:MAG: hypothetical protein K9M11_03520 [Candidatus Pacebacteria bacterium]|nr:hypothetical protein [Candidatus Paceibacterota bacterium]